MKKSAPKKKPLFVVGIRGQLMLFIGTMTLLTLVLVWGVITYALVPQYNRNIRNKLESKAAAIVAMIDTCDVPISNRDFGILVLNNDFWQNVNDTFNQKIINVDGCCVDFSDSTLRCLKAYESMYPCLLHESTGAFGGDFVYNVNTPLVIQMRQKLFEKGSLYEIARAGTSQQMLVGVLSADGQYGVIVSASLAQIATAAEEQTQVTGEITQNTTAIKDVSDEITASAMRDLDQAHNLKGRATNLNQQVSTFIL